jgi:hypothetical protein
MISGNSTYIMASQLLLIKRMLREFIPMLDEKDEFGRRMARCKDIEGFLEKINEMMTE